MHPLAMHREKLLASGVHTRSLNLNRILSKKRREVTLIVDPVLESLKTSSLPSVEADVAKANLGSVLKISGKLLNSLFLFNRERVWRTISAETRALYDCELASLFLVDHEVPNHLVLQMQDPWTRPESDKLRLEIVSKIKGGMTSHAASIGETIALNGESLAASPFAKNKPPIYLPSKVCYSVLYVPLKNRKGRLIGLLRLNNKNSSTNPRQATFASEEIATVETLAAQIVVLLENADAFDVLRGVIEGVQRSEDTQSAVQKILSRAIRLINADVAILGLWNRHRDVLEVAGSENVEPSPQLGDPIESQNVMRMLWDDATSCNDSREEPCLHEAQVDFGSRQPTTGRLCHPGALSSISTVIRVNDRSVGVLHLESFSRSFFDELDQNLLQAFIENVAIAVQSVNQSWLESDQGEGDRRTPALGNAEGLFQSVVEHLPLVMWRKNTGHKFVWVNDEFCRVNEKSRDMIIGKSDFEVFPSEYAARFREGDLQAINNGSFEDLEEPYVLENGETHFGHVVRTRISDLFGNLVGTQGFFRDVTGESWRRLFARAPIGFFELDVNGAILHVNEFKANLLNRKVNEIKGHKIWEFAREADAEAVEKFFKEMLTHSGGKDKSKGEDNIWHPLNLQQKEGTIVPVLVATQRITSFPGEVTRSLICAVREITTGSEVTAALKEPDPRYLARIREISIPVFCMDASLNLTFANNAYLARRGAEDWLEIAGKNDLQLSGKFGARFRADNQHVVKTGEVVDQVELHETIEGESELVRVLKFPVRDLEGNITGMQGVFWEVNEQREASRQLSNALEEARKEYQQIVNGASEGIFQSTMDGRFLGANPAMCALLGFRSEDDVVNWIEAGTARFADAGFADDYYRRLCASENGEAIRVERYQLRKVNGEQIWVSETVTKVKSRDGKNHLVGFVEDVTERRRNEEAKQQMLTMLAHQLRSPVWQSNERINSLVGQLESETGQIKGTVSSSSMQAATIRGLTRKTKAVAWSIELMSKLAHDGRVDELRRDDIAPRRLITMARESARDTMVISRTSKRLRAHSDDVLPAFTGVEVDDKLASSSGHIVGDADLVEQCVGNLVENAFKYSRPASELKIQFTLGYRFAILRVRNKPIVGFEIDAETAVSCRQKNWRGLAASASDADGTGLGLWFTDRIMNAHGGRLEIAETDAEGWNQFGLFFPLS